MRWLARVILVTGVALTMTCSSGKYISSENGIDAGSERLLLQGLIDDSTIWMSSSARNVEYIATPAYQSSEDFCRLFLIAVMKPDPTCQSNACQGERSHWINLYPKIADISGADIPNCNQVPIDDYFTVHGRLDESNLVEALEGIWRGVDRLDASGQLSDVDLSVIKRGLREIERRHSPSGYFVTATFGGRGLGDDANALSHEGLVLEVIWYAEDGAERYSVRRKAFEER